MGKYREDMQPNILDNLDYREIKSTAQKLKQGDKNLNRLIINRQPEQWKTF